MQSFKDLYYTFITSKPEDIKDVYENILEYNIKNETQTKMYLVNGFLKLLGYDVTNPDEIEYELSFEKDNINYRLDYLVHTGSENFIIESKAFNSKLDDNNRTQIKNYINSYSNARSGFLTNGIDFEFYIQNVEEAIYTFNILEILDSDRSNRFLFVKFLDYFSYYNDCDSLEDYIDKAIFRYNIFYNIDDLFNIILKNEKYFDGVSDKVDAEKLKSYIIDKLSE